MQHISVSSPLDFKKGENKVRFRSFPFSHILCRGGPKVESRHVKKNVGNFTSKNRTSKTLRFLIQQHVKIYDHTNLIFMTLISLHSILMFSLTLYFDVEKVDQTFSKKCFSSFVDLWKWKPFFTVQPEIEKGYLPFDQTIKRSP